MVALLVLLVTAVFATGAVANGTEGQRAPRMHFGGRVAITTVCFSVTNPAGGQSTLYGSRYIDRGARVDSSTPAIVLVHGIASSTENWDFSPTWSVARGLAAAGYVVYSYDRLGYAKSSYFSQPRGGTTLTTAAHQAELHRIVEEVQSGAFTTTTGSDCSAPQRPNRIRNRRVVIIGHSAGGWIVAGYPGQYHDVAAMIQADIPASSASLLGQSSGGGFTPDPAHPDYFQFFQTTQNCLDFNTYPPGVVQYVVNIACAPPFLDSPFGERDRAAPRDPL